MQLNKFTDYGLRVLLYVSLEREKLYTIAELAEQLQVSQNHLVKIVHFMSKEKWLITFRGKGGGIRIAPNTLNLKLGNIVRTLEHSTEIVNCNQPACVLRPYCRLKSALNEAIEQFYATLNQYTFSDFKLDPEVVPIFFVK